MADLFILFLTLTVFGAGVTIIDFLGIMDNKGENDSSDDAQGDAAGARQGSNLVHDRENNFSNDREKTGGKSGIKIAARFMNLLRSAVYFSLGFGPTGLFANFTGLSRTTGLIWAVAAGAAMIILARLLKKIIRRDLDSSISPDELLQEKGILLLPLEGENISKAAIRQYGREIEIYVRCSDKNSKLPKGKEIIIEDFDNDVYWIKPAE